MQYKPLVSIVIPAYNAANYLAEAIESALAQTYENIEIIVVNDGSADNGDTRAVALKYEGSIRYYEKENGGSSSALNYGIEKMSGEWFSWLSHDDLYYPEKIEKQIEYLNILGLEKTMLEKQVLFTANELVDSCGKFISAPSNKRVNEMCQTVKSISGNQYLIAEPTKYNFYGCGCLVHKSVFENIGAFDTKLRLLNDIDMWFRIYAKGYKIHYLPQLLVKARIHPKQVSRSIGFSYHNPEQDMFWQRSLDWLKDNFPRDFKLFYLYGRNAFYKTRRCEGRKAFNIAMQINPRKKLLLFFTQIIYTLRCMVRTCGKKIYILFMK